MLKRCVLYHSPSNSALTSLLLSEERRTMLFSATQTTKVTDLARISLRPGPVLIDVDKEESTSTVSTLSQGYAVCPAEHRFLLLFTFLEKKMIVFFSSCNSVKYHSELLNYIDVSVLDLHIRLLSFYLSIFLFTLTMQGKRKQQKRTNAFFNFVFSYNTTSNYEHNFIHTLHIAMAVTKLIKTSTFYSLSLLAISQLPRPHPSPTRNRTQTSNQIDNSCPDVGYHASGRRARRTRAPCSVEWVYSTS
jgi:hypothetical protein